MFHWLTRGPVPRLLLHARNAAADFPPFDRGPGARLARLGMMGFCLTAATWQAPWRPGITRGRSMEPTLQDGAPFLYDRTYYRTHPPRRGDVVVVQVERLLWVKRVYAVGGDSFWALRWPAGEGGRVDPISARDVKPYRRFLRSVRERTRRELTVVRVRVPPGQLFVVGDGPWSWDSREQGPVPGDHLVGKLLPWPGRPLPPAPAIERSFPSHSFARWNREPDPPQRSNPNRTG